MVDYTLLMDNLATLLQNLAENNKLLILGYDDELAGYIGQFLRYDGDVTLMEENKELTNLLETLYSEYD